MRVLGCAFAGLAGICAYLITLDEMHRHMRSRWRAHTESLHRAAVIAGFFVVLSGALAVLLPRLIVNR
jgi:predicted benzoate:H+ symporter BenE